MVIARRKILSTEISWENETKKRTLVSLSVTRKYPQGFRSTIAKPERLWKPSTLSLMKSQLWLLKQLFGPETNHFNTDNSLAEFTSKPSKEDFDNLFGLMYEEYFTKRSPEVSINSAAQTTLNNEDTPSSSSIIVEENEAPPLVSSSEEQISLISTNVAVESVQEDFVYLDKNTLITLYNSLMFEDTETSSTAADPSNMH
ncbi:hypothetical protein Tco_0757485 [Tanacetum coccineum]